MKLKIILAALLSTMSVQAQTNPPTLARRF